MKSRRLLVVTAAACLLALPALAGPHSRGSSMLETFDADGDGTLKQAEVDQFRNDRLAKFDADGDGQLTLEEYQVLWLDAMHERMVDAFQRLDDDGDALVTREEFAEPFARLVQRLDKDADGMVTKDEMHPKHEQTQGRHHGGHSDGSGPPRRLPR